MTRRGKDNETPTYRGAGAASEVERLLEQIRGLQKELSVAAEALADMRKNCEDALDAGARDRAELNAQSEKNAVLEAELQAMRSLHAVAQQKRDGHYRKLVAEQSRTKRLAEDLRRAKDLYAAAQHKRDGHYLHLEAERARSKALLDVARTLHAENQVLNASIALKLGKALLAMRTPRGILEFPGAVLSSFKEHKTRGGEPIRTAPFAPPRIAPVVIPEKVALPAMIQPVKAPPPVMKASTGEDVKRLSAFGWKQDLDTSKPVVMSVFDEFSRACFAPQASLIEPRPDNWEALLDRYEPKMLFVESTWKGNRGTWQYRVANYANPPGRELAEMVAGCRARNIPTVFWNKEDPVHFSNFIEAASGFDHVLTTAAEALPRYRERSTGKVGVLQFAAEESLHNPIGSANRNQRICFAGSFYANRFQERRDDQLMLLDAASRFDLDIYDRNHNPKALVRSDFEFPERFAPFIKPAIPYSEMGDAYRKYRVFLNVNSVIDSPTMFSRRVFELLACGTPIVSTWSLGIEEAFGDLVWLVKSAEEADEALRVLMTDDREWRRRSIEGVRRVLGRHTFRHRFQSVLREVGIDFTYQDVPSTIQVLAPAASTEEANAVLEAFSRQEMPMEVGKKLVLFCEGGAQPGVSMANVEVVPVGKALGFDAVARHPAVDRGSVQALMLPTCAYGDFHLYDQFLAKRYSGSMMVGTARDKAPLNEYRYGIPLEAGSVLFDAGTIGEAGGTPEAWLAGEVPSSDSDARRVFAGAQNGFSVVGCVADPDGVDLSLATRQ